MTNRELPQGWVTATLDQLVAEAGAITDGPFGSNLKSEYYTDRGPRVVRLGNIGDGVFVDDRYHISYERFAALAKHEVRARDVLVASLGDVLPRACVAPESLGPALVKADCIRVRPGTGVEPAYVMHVLNSPLVRRQVTMSIRGVGRPRINLGHLRNVVVPLAPTSEQRRIVAEVDRRLSHIEAARRSLSSAKLRLQSARRAVLEGVARGSILDLDSSEWKDRLTGSIGEVRGGIQKQPKRVPVKNAHPFLRVANVARGRLDLAEVHQIEVFDGELTTYQLVKGDLLVVEGNGSIDQIGRAAMWDGSIDGCVHQNHLIRVRPGDEVVPEFLALVWNAPSTIEQLKAVASSTSGLHTLTTGKVKSVKLRVPDTDVQRELVAEAERRLSLVEAGLRAVIEGLVKVDQLRHSLLAAASSGQLVRQDPDDEPAEITLERIRKARAELASSPKQLGARGARAT